jgi:hypothetical protein
VLSSISRVGCGVSNFLLCAMYVCVFAKMSVHTTERVSLGTMHVVPRGADTALILQQQRRRSSAHSRPSAFSASR